MFSEQCLLPGLHGYLIRFAPLAFIPDCQIRPRKVPSLIVSPPKINTFNRYLRRTPYVYRSLAIQYLLQAPRLRRGISQETYMTSYGCFRPNKKGCDLNCWYYRGGWHQSFPVLILPHFYSEKKFFYTKNTLVRFITLSCIVKDSRLLHSVELGIVSQIPSPGNSAKSP